MFVHVQVGPHGRVIGGGISHKWKEPDSQLVALIDALSAGLDDTLAAVGGKVVWWRRLWGYHSPPHYPEIVNQDGHYQPMYTEGKK